LAAFQARHQRLYGHHFPDRSVEAVGLRLHFLAPERQMVFPAMQPVAVATPRLPACRTVWLPDGPAELPVYYRPDLEPGFTLAGPGLILEDFASHLILPGFFVQVSAAGHLLLQR
jgi:N-methylhydantoinase A